jgi:type II secretory pathway component PulF
VTTRLTLQQKARFFHQLAVLLESGLPLSHSLTLAGRDLGAACQNYLSKASLAVGRGQGLAVVISQPPVYFDAWTIALIETAEYSGALSVVCRSIAIASERQHKQQRLYNSAKLSAIAIIWSLVILVVALLAGNPIILIQPSFWLFAIGFLILLIFALPLLAQRLQPASQNLPVLGKINQARSMLYFTELELPLSCGVSIASGLELLSKHIPDRSMAGKIAAIVPQVLAGKSLSKSLQGRFPAVAIGMIRTGEETGNLDAALQKLATYYEGELETSLRQLNSILIPLSLLAIGAIVALIGIWGITSYIKLLPD